MAELPALRSPDYRRFLTGVFVSNVGSWMQSTALGWLVIALTNSPALLGVVSAATTAPVLLLVLYAGVLADRVDRRRLLSGSQVAQGLCAGALALLTMIHVIAFWQIAVLALLAGSAQALGMPAFQAIVPALVGREAVGNAIALNSAQFNLSRVVGPMIAGVLIGLVGESTSFWLNALSFGAVVYVLTTIRIPSEAALPSVEQGLWGRLTDGLVYVRRERVLLYLLVLAAVPTIFLLPYFTLLPVFARDVLEIGAPGLGLLTASMGTGALLGALAVAVLRPAGGDGRLMLGGLAVMCLGVVAFALSTWVPFSCLALAIIGAAQQWYFNSANTLVQLLSPGRLRGRILSVYILTSFGVTPVGSLAAGALAQLVGAPVTLMVCAGVASLGSVAVIVACPELASLHGNALQRLRAAA